MATSLEGHYPHTPIDAARLESELRTHPDQAWCSRLLHTLQHGASIGYHGPRTPRTSKNLQSATLHPDIIDNELESECAKGHLAGPYSSPPLPNLQCSGVGVVPKKGGSWRMIMHLSAPHLNSINDGIDKEPYSLRYSTIDDATRLIAKAGPGCFLSKIDIKGAFRLIPVSRHDWELLGIHWRGSYYVDKQLPFGLRSAPFLFNELANALHWIITNNYHIPYLIHYLDDFLLISPTQPACLHAKNTIVTLFTNLGIPLSWNKIEGPSTSLTFLGIQLDTLRWQLRLPEDKLSNLLSLLTDWLTKKKCTKRQLLSLIGHLSFAAKVIPAGRIFLRRLIDLSTRTKALHHYLYLNQEARADIRWWITFLPTWNGSAPILQPDWTASPHMHLYTDASAIHGYGAFFNGAWFRGPWLPHQQLNSETGISIAWQELYAIVMAATAWGHLWAGRRIIAHCDNLAVNIWGRNSSKSPTIMTLVRKLFFIAATHHFTIHFSHIQGVNNSIADALSRNDITRFRKLAPNADSQMIALPTIL